MHPHSTIIRLLIVGMLVCLLMEVVEEAVMVVLLLLLLQCWVGLRQVNRGCMEGVCLVNIHILIWVNLVVQWVKQLSPVKPCTHLKVPWAAAVVVLVVVVVLECLINQVCMEEGLSFLDKRECTATMVVFILVLLPRRGV